jgi:hypothetical protein
MNFDDFSMAKKSMKTKSENLVATKKTCKKIFQYYDLVLKILSTTPNNIQTWL